MNTQDSFKATPMSAYNVTSQPKAKYNNIQDVSLESLQDRVQPRQVGTGVMRGSQTIINPADGSKVVLGIIPGTSGQFGFGFFDSDGNLIRRVTGVADYYFDPDNDNNNVVQLGKLSNNLYGGAFAKSGEDLVEGLA